MLSKMLINLIPTQSLKSLDICIYTMMALNQPSKLMRNLVSDSIITYKKEKSP